MPTAEDASAWLAHASTQNELGHSGVLGMHWGHRKAEPPPSGIKSHVTDQMAKQDAKQHTNLHADTSTDHNAMLQKARINAQVARRSAANPDYAKAFAYHKPKAEHALKVKQNITTSALVAGGAAYAIYANKDFLTRAAGSAALKVAARRGAKTAGSVLKAIGSKPVVALIKGADGVFRLAA